MGIIKKLIRVLLQTKKQYLYISDVVIKVCNKIKEPLHTQGFFFILKVLKQAV